MQVPCALYNDGMDRQPLYSRMADQLARDIAAGRYPVGSLLPTEPELAAQLQVSRSTVRAALASLEQRKLVSRRKNVGTRVESQKPQGGYGANLASLPDLVQWAQACARSIQSTGLLVMDRAQARALGCEPGSRWLCVQSLRYDASSGQEPVSWTDAYIDERFAKVLPLIQDQPSALMSELLEQAYGLDLATVEQEVLGWKLNKQQAQQLNTTPGGAALKIIRRYLTRDRQPVLVTVSVHPADRFSVKTTLTRH